MFGPTKGDRVRLGDTDRIIQVERDFITFGDEVKIGGGMVIRAGVGQSQITRAQGAMDTVITMRWSWIKPEVMTQMSACVMGGSRKLVRLVTPIRNLATI